MRLKTLYNHFQHLSVLIVPIPLQTPSAVGTEDQGEAEEAEEERRDRTATNHFPQRKCLSTSVQKYSEDKGAF